ncbi:hypothetical protein ACFYKX_07900 [Cytobacillus sp. FJAT-54145]|uniref:Uncharacterized protein n=1 Tax=Cytobacillus spartinae TaxID=3299023 RepID=A0ABW6K8L8_9BACI
MINNTNEDYKKNQQDEKKEVLEISSTGYGFESHITPKEENKTTEPVE